MRVVIKAELEELDSLRIMGNFSVNNKKMNMVTLAGLKKYFYEKKKR